MEQRPAAVCALNAAQVVGDLALKLRNRCLAAPMREQHIFGGHCRVRFQLEYKMPVGLLLGQQRTCSFGNGVVKLRWRDTGRGLSRPDLSKGVRHLKPSRA